MAEITAAAVNEFRKQTGLGQMECMKLLTEADGDSKKALTLAKERALVKVGKAAGRATGAGRIECYIHHDARSGVLLELDCETDFVARNEDFIQLSKDLAVHIMAANPNAVRREEVDTELVEEQKRIFLTQVQDKPEQIRSKIVDGMLDKWYAEIVLLDQKFVKDDSKSIQDMLNDTIAKMGENIKVARFSRFVVGEVIEETEDSEESAG